MTAANDNFCEVSTTHHRVAAGASSASERSEGVHAYCESLARELTVALSQLLKVPLTIQPEGAVNVQYGEFLAKLEEAGCCWLLKVGEETIWLELSSPIARSIANALLDAPSDAAYQSDCPPTPAERRLLGRFVEAAGEAMRQLMQPAPVGTQEANPSDAPPATQDDHDREMVQATFTIRLLSCQGRLRLCMPRELIADRPAPAAAPEPADLATSGEPEARDGKCIDLTVVAPETTILLEDLRAMAPGDVLVTDADVNAEVLVYVDGRRRYAARLGSRNGKRAITILRRLDDGDRPADSETKR